MQREKVCSHGYQADGATALGDCFLQPERERGYFCCTCKKKPLSSVLPRFDDECHLHCVSILLFITIATQLQRLLINVPVRCCLYLVSKML